MTAVLDMQKIHYSLEKFSDFIRGSGAGALPGYAAARATVVIEILRAFEEKLRARGTRAEEIDYHLGTVIYAACQLQSYVTGDKSDIANQNAALVYRDFLATKIEKLHLLELDLVEQDLDAWSAIS